MLEMIQKTPKQFSYRALKKNCLESIGPCPISVEQVSCQIWCWTRTQLRHRNVRCHMGCISMLKLFDKPQQDEKGRSHHLVLLS